MITISFNPNGNLMRGCIIWGMWIALLNESLSLNKGFYFANFPILFFKQKLWSQWFCASSSQHFNHPYPQPLLHPLGHLQAAVQPVKEPVKGLLGPLLEMAHTHLLPSHCPELVAASIWFKWSWEVKSTCVPTEGENVWKTYSVFSVTVRCYYSSQCKAKKDKD